MGSYESSKRTALIDRGCAPLEKEVRRAWFAAQAETGAAALAQVVETVPAVDASETITEVL